MQQQSYDDFNNSVLTTALACYGIEPNTITRIDSHDSFIYSYHQQAEEFILRLTHSLQKSANLILGEVDWIDYLANGGVTCAKAIASKNGRLAEVIEVEDSYFTVTVFEKALGRHIGAEDMTPELYQTWGKLLGRIHRLSKDYQPANPTWTRLDWTDDNLTVETFFPPTESLALDKFRQTVAYLHTLPKDKDSYGLIHNDAHGGNFFLHNNQMILFDFDGCLYSWYINDIAIVLFYALVDVPDGQDRQTFALEFMRHFLQGYRQENHLNPTWLAEIPHFLKLRELDTYGLIHFNQIDDWWSARFMPGRKHKIEHDIPYVNLDIAALL